MSVIIGIDPGLQHTGWGLIRRNGNSLSFIACGIIHTAPHEGAIATRLASISRHLLEVVERYKPQSAAVEETFVNVNGQSTLKLGQARGAILLTLMQAGLDVHEYAANLIKKTVVGAGHADKRQVAQMVQILLSGCGGKHGADASDALAAAICHAHHS